MTFLQKMKIRQIIEVEHAKLELPISKMKIRKGSNAFQKALKKNKGGAIIAEFKRSSPSRGEINQSANLKDYIKLYDRYADAISILTEKKYFSGNVKLLKDARKYTKKPIVRKDFFLDPYQIYEARHFGADAVLLIAGFLSVSEIKEMLKVCKKLGMDALVECDSEETLKIALDSGCKILGINNRNLDTMEENFNTTEKLISKIPLKARKKLIIVSESSIHSRSQIESLNGKANAFLVGSSIMSSRVPEIKLKELTGKLLVKICGTTNVSDAQDAVRAGADVIGLNFYEKSPRYVTIKEGKKIADAVRDKVLIAGVFVNEMPERVEIICRELGLDFVQFSGDETPAYVRQFGNRAIKAIRMKDKKSIDEAQMFDANKIMLDSFAEKSYGGTGKQFDTALIDLKKIIGKELVFSGGLNEKNVKGIIKKFRPFMVDVCSGVEKHPGKKSSAKMKAFVKSSIGASK